MVAPEQPGKATLVTMLVPNGLKTGRCLKVVVPRKALTRLFVPKEQPRPSQTPGTTHPTRLRTPAPGTVGLTHRPTGAQGPIPLARMQKPKPEQHQVRAKIVNAVLCRSQVRLKLKNLTD